MVDWYFIQRIDAMQNQIFLVWVSGLDKISEAQRQKVLSMLNSGSEKSA